MVLNKIDLIDDNKLKELKEKYKKFDPIFISVHQETGIEELKEKIIQQLKKPE